MKQLTLGLITVSIICVSLNAVAQNFSLSSTLVPDPRAAEDDFGTSVDVDGDYAIVGASQITFITNPTPGSGFAVIYERNPTTGQWSAVQRIVSNDGAAGDEFGYSVAISGDYAVVGAPAADGAGTPNQNIGAVYLFHRNTSGSWQQVQKLQGGFGFKSAGTSVDIEGNDVIIGASGVTSAVNYDVGAAKVYQINGVGSLDEVATLTPTDNSEHAFGISVGISGDYAVVGADRFEAPTGSSNDDNVGCAYLFKRTGSSWGAGQRVLSENPGWDQFYGKHVSISGNTSIVRGNRQGGGADIYEHSGSSWTKTQTIASGISIEGVSINGNFAAVGSYGTDASVFQRSGSNWSNLQTVQPASDSWGYGCSVSISGGVLFVGAEGDNFDANGQNELSRAGKAYIYEDPVIQSVGENRLDASVRLYPVPATGRLTIDLQEVKLTGTVVISVFDNVGRKVLNQSNSLKLVNLDVSDLNSGMYLIQIQTSHATISKRIVIQ